MPRIALLALVCLLAACGATTPKPSPEVSSAAPPLFDTFGTLHRDIGSPVPAAQRYFDQGLRMAYGFNHQAAGRAFAEAAKLDPACAMCLWGQALVLGPNINQSMDPAMAANATALAKRAAALSAHAKPADRALIEALRLRYTAPAPTHRSALDAAYAKAMGDAASRFPDDDDIATLYAEALMDLTPWSYWTAQGQQTEHTPRILAALESVLARNPQHIGAMHYYIHATEASPNPGRAERYADALAAQAPGSGHLVHMPAHTYIRLGRYHDATLSNFAAANADNTFLAICRGSNGSYPLGYVPHNWHFASMSAGLTGSRTLALQAALQTAKRADQTLMGKPPMEFMQVFAATPLLTHVRFGDWEAILAEAVPANELPYPAAIRHFARGMAHMRTGQLGEATRDAEALHQITTAAATANIEFGTNNADAVLRVADALLRGELLRTQGQHTQALASLRQAAAAEDALHYNEPADWPLPVRWYLGAALLEAGDAAGAAQAYQQDLQTYPSNGWSLFGLAKAQRALNDPAAAAASERQQAIAWQWADAPLTASRY
jgi:tetratricopeptide (TPR) repeat protein